MSRKPTKSRRSLREWRITLVRRSGQYLGVVEAADEAAAIRAAAERWGIDPERQRRLIAQRIGE